MQIVYFLLSISVLVLIHEFGHFLVARLLGVKVLTFSLGFGPALFQIRGRETTFRVGILPFGGFVRLLEERDILEGTRNWQTSSSKIDALTAEDRRRSFQGQSMSRRMLIVLAGPVMNFILPFLLFFAALFNTGRYIEPIIGHVFVGSPADGVLLPGDTILSINGETIASYSEIQERIASSAGQKLVMRVRRSLEPSKNQIARDEIIEVLVIPKPIREKTEFGDVKIVGRAGIRSAYSLASIGIRNSNSAAYRAGLRTFDIITHVKGTATPKFLDLERQFRNNLGHAVPVNFLRPRSLAWPSAQNSLLEFAVYDPYVIMLAPDSAPLCEGGGLKCTGIEHSDLYVSNVPEGSSEWRAGLRTGDRITTLDGNRVQSWQDFVDDLIESGDKTRELGWERMGQSKTGLLRIRKEEWVDVTGQTLERYVWRSAHFAPVHPAALLRNPSPIKHALIASMAETANMMRFLIKSGSRLFAGKMTLQSISGPLAIYDVAGRASDRGFRDFFWVMALISINLGLLNLLPIPTLDGGQLLFLGIETISRRPIPLRVRQVMTIIGLFLLMALMFIALRNDLNRRFHTTTQSSSNR